MKFEIGSLEVCKSNSEELLINLFYSYFTLTSLRFVYVYEDNVIYTTADNKHLLEQFEFVFYTVLGYALIRFRSIF